MNTAANAPPLTGSTPATADSRARMSSPGRIALIENRDVYRDLQNRELEPTGPSDRFGQGGAAGSAPGGAGMQPDYFLYARIMEMPNRATSYFFCEFILTNANKRTLGRCT